jgi:uncharacterized protein DUF5060
MSPKLTTRRSPVVGYDRRVLFSVRLLFRTRSSLARVVFLLFCGATTASAAGMYSRIEASFNLPGLATDPFDYAATDVKVSILQPDSTTKVLPAFFDGGTTWRVRHTPPLAGSYAITAITLNGSPAAYNNLQPANWTVTGSPVNAGFVRRDPSNSNRFVLDNGRRHFPAGHNVAWSSTSANALDIFPKMGPAHENWSRVWMTHFFEGQGLGLNLDWPKVGGTFGQLSLANASNWDAIVTAAERNDIYFQMVLQHHGQYSTSVDANWNQNPWNTANGGFLTNATQFFTNSMAKTLTKRKYRYIIARWGYSPSIMAWELFNEVQFTDAAQSGQWSIVGAWHDELALFLKAQDVYDHLVTTSSEMNQPIWAQTDYYQHHDYPSDLITALADPAGSPVPIRPVFGGECGLQSTPQWGVSAPIWAGLMGAQSGNAQPWFWDRIDPNREYVHFRAVSDFVRFSGFADQDTLNRSSPTVTCPVISSLVFSPGGGFGTNNGPDTFTVGSAAPAGMGTAPSFLQGNFHRTDFKMTNGYTFLVNYAQAGTFAVQVTLIASSGATLQMFRDGVLQTNVPFAAAGSDVTTNVTFTINVPAGAHSVKLYNPGQDWFVIGNITLNPYVSMLGAYQVGNTNFAGLWLWHRTNIYRSTATATLSGSFPLSGLKPGTYLGTWWDTVAATVISNFTFTVVDTNPVTIPTPVILRSAAFFAGTPPAAGFTAPGLTHTLGSNSPALTLPLTITNSGGLPLAWSLSVTGVSPVAWSALNSVQAGGPAYAWHDISGTGLDITTNFTALAAPKSAQDEGIAGPFNLGFSFPFFNGAQASGSFTQLYVSPNGFVSFSPFAGDRSANGTLPNASAPTNLIALFWDDLILTNVLSHVYTLADPVAGTFTVQFEKAQFRGSASNINATCQLVLKTSGEILMQYKSMNFSNTCTVGLQNAAGNSGLQLAFNQNYLQPNFAIRLTPARWLAFDANAGVVPTSDADTVNVSLNPAGLAYGTYEATLLIGTGDALQPQFTVPVELEVSAIGTWRQTHFGTAANSGNAADTADPDADGLVNVLEYAFNSNPNVSSPNPISSAIVADHVTLTFQRTRPAPPDLAYIAEVTDDLASGIWNSGPAYTSQAVIDNGDGTETVTVTDLTAIGSAPRHFLRIRIVRL